MIGFLLVQAALAWSAEAEKLCPNRPVIVRVKPEKADLVKTRFEVMSSLPYHIDKKEDGKETELRIRYRCPAPGDQFGAPDEAGLLLRVSQALIPDGKKLGVKSIKLGPP